MYILNAIQSKTPTDTECKTESENSNLHGSLLMYMRPTELFKGTTFFTVYAKISMQMILPLHLLGVHVALHLIFIMFPKRSLGNILFLLCFLLLLCSPNVVWETYCFYSVSYYYYYSSSSSSFSSPVLFCPGMFSKTTGGINMKLSRMTV